MSTILISTSYRKLRHRELIQGLTANYAARIPAQAAWCRAGNDNYYAVPPFMKIRKGFL